MCTPTADVDLSHLGRPRSPPPGENGISTSDPPQSPLIQDGQQERLFPVQLSLSRPWVDSIEVLVPADI